MTVSTHVLDVARGRPAAGLSVTLSRRGADGGWSVVGRATTDREGRVREFSQRGLQPGVYRLEFDTDRYFKESGSSAFYPEVSVVFTLPGAEHLHVPLLLSPFGYSTYKGQ